MYPKIMRILITHTHTHTYIYMCVCVCVYMGSYKIPLFAVVYLREVYFFIP